MIVSLGELQTAVERATRGCGLARGLASRAGLTARFLARQGIDPLSLVFGVLASADHSHNTPQWRERDLTLAADLPPGITGAAIVLAPLACDWLLAFPGEARIVDLGKVDSAAWVAACAGLAMERGRIAISAHGVAEDDAVSAPVRLTLSSHPNKSSMPTRLRDIPMGGVAVSDADWDRINALAARTFVPASDVSRQTGAGFQAASVREKILQPGVPIEFSE